MDNNSKNILVCPLGWGLGHASRDIPIINLLIAKGHNVIVAGDVRQLALVKDSFPNIEALPFPSLKVNLSKSNFQFFSLLWVAFRLPFFNIWEHRRLKKIIREHNIDTVISDNRYGVWCHTVKSIIVTHQLRVIPPYPFMWATRITEFLVSRWLSRFNEVWVPDYCNERNVAGFLSEPSRLKNLHYVGLLSRFSGISIDGVFSGFQMVVVVSGPEPQRSIFADLSATLAQNRGLSCLIIEGRPEAGTVPRNVDGVWRVGHLPQFQFALALKNAEYLVVRGGYSTIMDLLALGISGMLVPTPGQTEQEYLAKYLSEKGLFQAVVQQDLINVDLDRTKKVSIPIYKSEKALEDAINQL
jgi:uncharacterized protein (TIGR00661 family)